MLTFMILPSYAEGFEVKHADSLEVIENVINIKGDVVILYKNISIKAPSGTIVTSAKGDPETASFQGRVIVEMKDKKLDADTVTIAIKNKKIIAEGNTVSEIKDKNGEVIRTVADTQNFDEGGEGTKGSGNVITTYKDVTVTADEFIVVYKDKNPNEAIYYGINKHACLKEPATTTYAKSITFDINTKTIHASGEVASTIMPDKKDEQEKQDPVHVLADDVFIQENKEVIAKGSSKKVKLTYQDTIGESLIAYLYNNKETGKPEQAVFHGSADVTQVDKRLISEEVIFNFANKTLISNTATNIRPKTIIYKDKK